MTDVAQDVDGRRLRREQNRETVLDALVELFAEGDYQPSAAEIAARAGLSPRSLFRYFDDVDDLNRAAIERHMSAARPLFEIDVARDAPTDRKIARVVAARVRLFDTMEPGARAARACAHRSPVVAEQLAENRRHFREQVARLFEPELRAQPDALPMLDVLLSFETHQLLRHDQKLSRAKTITALTGAITALLDHGGHR